MAVTIYDIAKEAGFSASTVSLVLNENKTRIAISKKTQDKVRDTAKRLGYEPNAMARSLRNKKSYNIGVVFGSGLSLINDIDTADHLSGIGAAFDGSPYNMTMLSGYENIAGQTIKMAKANMVDGLLYLIHSATYDCFHTVIPEELGRHDIGYFGIQMHPVFINPNCVCLQAAHGCRLAVEHLAGLGNREIGLINPLERRHHSTNDIVRGFTDAVSEFGISTSTVLNRDDYLYAAPEYGAQFRYDNGYRLARHLLMNDELLESYLVYADTMAMGFADGLKDAGVKVPDDVRLIGFGNALTKEKGVDFLTTIDARRSESGRLAARALMDILDRKAESRRTEPIFVEPKLIVRKSCGKNA